MKIAFFIGSVDISGGTYVIYQHAQFAKRAGHDVTMVVLYPFTEDQKQWHPAAKEFRFVPVAELQDEHFDLAVATWWRTAAEIQTISASQYCFFVQSIESRFYPPNEAPLRALVDSTYDLGLPMVTEAQWIQRHLSDNYNSVPGLVLNGIRKDLYSPNGPRVAPLPSPGSLRVLIEGPFGVFFKNLGSSIRLARRSNVDSAWLLTSTEIGSYPGIDRTFSRVPITEVGAIYRSCDVLLKLSYVEGMFGPPLEMFHCGGTAVVYDVTGHDEYIRNGVNGIVIDRDDETGVVAALNALREDTDYLRSLKQGAIETAEGWPDWDSSSSKFLNELLRIMDSPRLDREAIAARNADFMSRYVEDENSRLAILPKRNVPVTTRLADRLSRYPRFKHYRRIFGHIRESW